MRITIQSIHFTAADKLKAHLQRRCDKLDQFFDRIIDGDVFLKVRDEVKGENKFVEIKVRVPGETLIAKEQGSSFEQAADLCTDKLKTQLLKFKEKLRTH